jgi:hypothetical protein
MINNLYYDASKSEKQFYIITQKESLEILIGSMTRSTVKKLKKVILGLNFL